MQYTVVLPTRTAVAGHPTAIGQLPQMLVGIDQMLNPLLMHLGRLEDADVAGDPQAIAEYLNDLFYEHSGDLTAAGSVDGMFLSEPAWNDLVGLISDLYRIIVEHRRALLVEIPHGFVFEISFHRWVGYDMELIVRYTQTGTAM